MTKSKKHFVCLVCPQSCELTVKKKKDQGLEVEGNKCPRGRDFGQQEWLEPKRELTTTVRIKKAFNPVLPVRTSVPVPLKSFKKILQFLDTVEVEAPVKSGEILVSQIAGLKSVDLVATQTENRDES